MFLVVSRLDVHFGFERQLFLCARSGAQKVGRLERNLLTPDLSKDPTTIAHKFSESMHGIMEIYSIQTELNNL